jgi:lipopolysaccharide/colanic/teichoic acid biosynthesis glycosyltransferase
MGIKTVRNPRLYINGVIILAALFYFFGLSLFSPPSIDSDVIKVVIINILIWFLSAEITDKYKTKFSGYNYRYLAAPYCKSVVVHFVLLYISFLFYDVPPQMKMIQYQSIILSYLLEFAITSIVIAAKKRKNRFNAIENYKEDAVLDEEPCYPEDKEGNMVPLTDLPEFLFNNDERIPAELFKNIKVLYSAVVKDRDVIFGEGEPALYLKDIEKQICENRDINGRLRDLHTGLKPNGFMVIRYAAAGSGKRGSISKAEMWGRLHYCGFEVIKEIEAGGEYYLLSQKKRNVSGQKHSSKSWLIRLGRTGYEGRIFYVYKLRTMYPYSEFIQRKVFELNSLGNAGKINQDFRITGCGRFLRKYWIDEIPQLINWIKSDIKLVGIRGMSLHYFNLYPEEYKSVYIRVKPGLIPPIFDDSDCGFETIKNEELNYLNSYSTAPFKTDLKCFFVTFAKIIFKNYRGR